MWKTILRGPRPPLVRWEKQRKDPKKETKSKDASKVQKVVQVQREGESRTGLLTRTEREKKRLAAAEEAVIAAVQCRDECIKALAKGERRLKELQLQEKSFVALVPDAEAELVRLRARVAELHGSANVHQRHTKQRICSSGGHARVDSSRVVSLDGRPSVRRTCRKLLSKETTVESSG